MLSCRLEIGTSLLHPYVINKMYPLDKLIETCQGIVLTEIRNNIAIASSIRE